MCLKMATIHAHGQSAIEAMLRQVAHLILVFANRLRQLCPIAAGAAMDSIYRNLNWIACPSACTCILAASAVSSRGTKLFQQIGVRRIHPRLALRRTTAHVP